MLHNYKITWMKEVDSTNLEAARSIETAGDGSVWIAEFQTHGRGQRGNSWESARGKNLTFTMFIKPEGIAASEQFIVSQFVTLGILKYLKNRGVEARIKWPNDIYVSDRKICGILIENSITGDKLSASIIGIGLNLNQTQFASDAPNPTSLLLEVRDSLSPEHEKEFSLEDELEELLNFFHSLYYDRRIADTKRIEKEYLDSLYRKDEYFYYYDFLLNEKIYARIVGVDKSACLILQLKNGLRRSYSFKEVGYIIEKSNNQQSIINNQSK